MDDLRTPDFVAPWIRTTGHEPSRRCRVMWVVFADGDLSDDVALVPVRFGIPYAESVALFDVQRHDAYGDPEWFEQWRSPAAKVVAMQQSTESAGALETATVCYTLVAELEDPEDLGHLQAGWGLVRWLVERGATAALDVWAGRYHGAESIRGFDPDAPYDITTEITIVREPEARAPEGEHWYYTSGLQKVGRPDLVAAGSLADSPFVTEVLFAIARMMYEGAMPATPEHIITIEPSIRLLLRPAPSPTWAADQFGLDNDVRLLFDHEGESLGGMAAWWRSHGRFEA